MATSESQGNAVDLPDNVANDASVASPLSHVVDFAERAAKLGALLAVLGYMSLRAHLNRLGISSTSTLSAERYLMEIYQLVLVTLPLVFYATVLTLVFLPFALQIVSRRAESASAQVDTDVVGADPRLPALVLLIMTLFFGWLVVAYGRNLKTTDVVVGPLRLEALRTASGETPYFLLCLVSAMAYLLYVRLAPQAAPSRSTRTLSPPSRRASRWLWQLVAVANGALLLHIPMVHGYLMHSQKYPIAQLVLDKPPLTLYGLLVLESDDTLTLWRAEKGIGQVTRVPRDQILLLNVGPVRNILQEAALAVQTRKARPERRLLFSDIARPSAKPAATSLPARSKPVPRR
jgi:hypothetical protein